MLTNFHTHTKRCLHASGTEEDYVRQAVENGLCQLGFSDHGPFPDRRFGYRMPFEELEAYREELDRLREVYAEQLTIYKGLEIEYFPSSRTYYQELLSGYGMDYLALGEHYFYGKDGEICNIAFAESTEDFLYYAQGVCEAIDTGFFRFVAHPDILFAHGFPFDQNTARACEMIIAAAKAHDAVLELNANGLRREERIYPEGKRHPYPYLRFWDMVKDADIRVIVGSDCHSPHQLFDSTVQQARKLAELKGLRLIDTIMREEQDNEASTHS